MKKIKIAVSGIGGGAGQSILKAFYPSDYQIVGLDGNLDGTGLYAVPTGHKIPYANSPDYTSRLLEILKKEDCRMMFPGLDAELPVLAAQREVFQKEGITLVVSSPEVVEIADNKILTPQFLLEAGLPTPATCEYADWAAGTTGGIGFPFILKPKKGGARSKDVFVVKNEKDLAKYAHLQAEHFIVQEYIEGDEYTCGSVSFDGECFGVIVMRRILRDGDTYKAFVEFNPAIEEAVRRVISHLKPFGPLNVQLRLKDGVPYIFELNARCSGTTGARSLSGFNEPVAIADYLLKGMKPHFEIRETTIFRYWKELVVGKDLLCEMEKSGQVENPDYLSL